MSKEKGVNVQVLLRCRPFSNDELRSNAPQVVTCNEYQREVAVSQNIAGVFTFDKVFGPSARQKDLYEESIVPIVNEVLEGDSNVQFLHMDKLELERLIQWKVNVREQSVGQIEKYLQVQVSFLEQ